MSTYTKTTNFTAKDNLTSGDPAKVIKGSEFDTEFNAIETAVNSKADKNNGVHTGTTTISTANIDTLQIDSVTVTATSAELNTLDGITSTTAELNKLDGYTGDVTDLNKLASVTATATEINVLDGSTATTADLNKLAGVTATSTELNLLDGVTATTAELNYVDGVTSSVQTQLDGKQPLDAQLTDIAGLTPADGTFIVGNGTNFVAESGDTAIASLGVTATASELNTLDGITATTTELNYTDGVTSNIQTQLNTKAPIASPTFTGTTTIPTVDINGGTIDGVSITGTTASFSGEISANGGIALGDNDKATFGASDDLQIYHDGSTSYIDDSGTGNFVIKSEDFYVYGSATLEPKIRAITNAEVGLYYNGSEKLATTSTGVDVTGTVTADGLTVDGDAIAQSTSSSTTFEIKSGQGLATTGESKLVLRALNSASGTSYSTSEIVSVSSGGGDNDLFLRTTTDPSGAQNRIKIDSDGDVSFYEDTGTTAKMVWDASAERLGIGESNPDTSLDVVGGSADSVVDTLTLKNDSNGVSAGVGINFVVDGVNDVPISAIYGQRTGASYHQGSLQFLTNDNTGGGLLERMRIDSSGKVGIGTASPSAKLDVLTGADQRFLINTLSDDVFIGAVNGTNTAYQELFINGSTLKMGTNGAERMRINSVGNVGIGTSSPIAKLTVDGQIRASGSLGYGFNSPGDTDGGMFSPSDGVVTFKTNGAERARIDSSGNLLVGKTSSSGTVEGVTIEPNAVITTRTSNPSLVANRLSTDGEVIRILKNSSTVGSIGSYSGELFISGEGNRGGIGFYDHATGAAIRPTNSDGSISDGDTDLGWTDSRFKDLYLSGGVYLGGTGSVNKLDDYEEGVWTPTIAGTTTEGVGTYTARQGTYTKVGNLVSITAHVSWTALTGTGNLELINLPFAAKSTSDYRAVTSIFHENITLFTNYVMQALILPSSTFLVIRQVPVGGGSALSVNLDTSGGFLFTMTYHTDS